ncbi:MAG TPA: A24 family peptidase [Methylocella sp.]|jgi:leader peptidase (prepilin peptidase)/N-methyltransferase
MSGTKLCDFAKSGPPVLAKRMHPAGGGIEIAVAGRGAASWRGLIIKYAAFAGLACAIAIASLVAAPGTPGLLGSALGLLMLAIAIADLRSFIIPDGLTAAAFLLALVNSTNESFESIPENIAVAALRGLVLALAFFALREIYFRLRHRHGIGLGDVKLAAAAGAWLDWSLIPVAIEIAALTALTLYMASEIFRRRPLCAAAKLPFGLFFAPAIWFCWLLNAIYIKI